HHRPGGQRPGVRMSRARRLRGLLLSRVPADRPGDGGRPGRHLRLGGDLHRLPRRAHPRQRIALTPESPMARPTFTTRDLPLWVRGDTNAFFGFGVNVLVNVLTLTSLCLFVVHLSTGNVYHTILPALGIAIV